MKKSILLFLTFVVCAATFTVSCNDDDNNGPATNTDFAIGTWKLIEAYEGTQTISLTSCQLMEAYIIGPDGQFSHELFANSGHGKTNSARKNGSNVMNGDDDGDDDGSDDEDDDSGDDGEDDSNDDGEDDSNDDGSDDTSDDGSDDDGGNTGTCVSDRLEIGYWSLINGNTYEFTANNVPVIRNITFSENNTKFSYEVTTVSGGVSTTKKYVFQRQ